MVGIGLCFCGATSQSVAGLCSCCDLVMCGKIVMGCLVSGFEALHSRVTFAKLCLADRARRGRDIGSALHIPDNDACLWYMCATPGYEGSSEIFEGILGSCMAFDPAYNAFCINRSSHDCLEIGRRNACLHTLRSCFALCRSKQRRA